MNYGNSDPSTQGQRITRQVGQPDQRPTASAPSAPPPPVSILDGDVQGDAQQNLVAKIQGFTAPSPVSPTDDQKFVKYDDPSASFVMAAPSVTLGGDVTGPSGANTVGKLQNVPVNVPVSPTDDGKVATFDNASGHIVWNAPTATAVSMAGDVSGSSGACTVDKLKNLPITAPVSPSDNGRFLEFTGGGYQWGTPTVPPTTTLVLFCYSTWTEALPMPTSGVGGVSNSGYPYTRWRVPASGTITLLQLASTFDSSAGTVTATVFLNGTSVATVSRTTGGTGAPEPTETLASVSVSVSAGDRIQITFACTGSTPTASNKWACFLFGHF